MFWLKVISDMNVEDIGFGLMVYFGLLVLICVLFCKIDWLMLIELYFVDF